MASESGLALQFCNSLTAGDLQRRISALAAVAERNLIIVGSPGHIATFDATTSVRQALMVIPKGHTPRVIQVAPSGAHLLVACIEWSVYHLPIKSLKPTLVLSLADVKKKSLDHPIMCLMSASSINKSPILFVTNRLKDSLRTAYLMNVPEKAKISKELQPGNKLNLEKGKGAVALATHPLAPVLYVLTANGELQLYQHLHGAAALQPLFQFTMLLEESKVPTALVEGAHLSSVRCPRVASAAMIFIFMPRISLFYIMTHVPGESPKPFMRVPWPHANHVLTIDISRSLNSLIVIAGTAGTECRFRMRAWTILGEQGCTLEELKLLPRPCSQHVGRLSGGAQASVVFKQPDWSNLWNGAAELPPASAQSGVLDLTSPVYPDHPSAAYSAIPGAAKITASTNLCVVRYYLRSAASSTQAASLHAPLAIFRFLDLDHPTLRHPSAIVGALHCSPMDWHVSDVDGDAQQMVPHTVPFLQGHKVVQFMPATQESRVMCLLATRDAQNKLVALDSLEYSPRQHCCIVFGALMEDGTQRRFTFCDLSGNANPSDHLPQYQPGVMAAFLGPRHETFAVLESSALGADNIAIYSLSDFSESSLLGYTYAELETGDSIVALWRGPPATQLLEAAEYDIAGELVERDDPPGSGLALLSTRHGSLMLVQLPSMQDVDEEGAELEPCVVQYELPLLEGERVLQVAWTTMVLPEQVGFPEHCLGAILTTFRIIVTDGCLSALQSISISEPSLAVTHAITSLLWVGPALLLSHASGRIEQLLPNSKRAHVAAVSRHGTYVLAGALPDRLMLLHYRSDKWLMVSRKVHTAAIVMQAWLGLLTTRHAYGTWPNVRLELQHIVKHYNVQAASDVGLAEALLSSGCGDLMQHCVDIVSSAAISRCAHAAASNDWKYATERVIQEYEVSAYAPCAPPEGSKLRQVLVTVSLGAMSQGKWSCAERCLSASGETLLLMLLHALQHNRRALQQAVMQSNSESATHTLAMLLLAADGRIGLRQTLQKDWYMSRPVQDTDASTWQFAERLFPDVRSRADRSLRDDVAAGPGEEGPVAPLETGSLAAHLGLTHTEILANVAQIPEGASARLWDGASQLLSAVTGNLDALGRATEAQAALSPEEEADERERAQFVAKFQNDAAFLDELGGAGGGESEMPPAKEKGDPVKEESGFFSLGSSSVDEEELDLNERNLRQAAPKPKEASAADKNAALGPPGSVPLGMKKKQAAGDIAALQAATMDVWADLGIEKPVQEGGEEEGDDLAEEQVEDEDPFAVFGDMALPPVEEPVGMPDLESSSVAASTNVTEPHDSAAVSSAVAPSVSDATSQPPQQQGGASDAPAAQQQGSAHEPPAAQQQEQQGPPAPPPGPPDATNVPGFQYGVQTMFAGQWDAARAYFAQAFDACSGPTRCQVAQYIATVGILGSYQQVGQQMASRLSRFAAGLPLLMLDHSSVLVNDAVGRNMHSGNYTWCFKLLEHFGSYCASIGRPDLAHGVYLRMQQVQMVGTGDASVSASEDVQGFASRIDAAATIQDIERLVSSLKAGLI